MKKKKQISSKQEKVYEFSAAPPGALYYQVADAGSNETVLWYVGRTRYSGAFSEYVEHGWAVELTPRPFGRRSARALARRLDHEHKTETVWQGKSYGQLCR